MASPKDIIAKITLSFSEAGRKVSTDNKVKSSFFIRRITENLQTLYNSNDFVVFSKELRNQEFRRSEFLFDIHVCEKEYTVSSVHKKRFPYAKKSILIIESEFDENTKESAIDLNLRFTQIT